MNYGTSLCGFSIKRGELLALWCGFENLFFMNFLRFSWSSGILERITTDLIQFGRYTRIYRYSIDRTACKFDNFPFFFIN